MRDAFYEILLDCLNLYEICMKKSGSNHRCVPELSHSFVFFCVLAWVCVPVMRQYTIVPDLLMQPSFFLSIQPASRFSLLFLAGTTFLNFLRSVPPCFVRVQSISRGHYRNHAFNTLQVCDIKGNPDASRFEWMKNFMKWLLIQQPGCRAAKLCLLSSLF